MKNSRYALFFIFFLSGFSGLIYESIWSHYIKLVAGHAAYAQTIVLAIFMGGLALGAWLVSKVSTKIQNPLLWYAAIEGTIGVFGIFFHKEFLFFNDLLFNTLAQFEFFTENFEFFKWTIAIILLLPQAILLGTTFPLMSAAIIRTEKKASGYILGMLYFCNSIGAALGVLFSGFLLIELVGLPGTTLTAGILNVLLATVAWLMARRLNLDSAQSTIVQTRDIPQQKVTIFIAIAFFTGLASFFYEISWIRMLSLVLGSSVQAFELMLCAFITGLALGSFYIRKRLDIIENPVRYLAKVQVLMGILAMATLPLYMETFSIMTFIQKALARTDSGYLLFNISSQIIAFIVMLPATFMAGMTLPLITNILINSGSGEASIGRVYASNTVGAIIGVVIASHFLMPIIGLKGLIVSGGLVDISVGFGLLFLIKPRWNLKLVSGLVVTTGFLVIFSSTDFNKARLSSGVYRNGMATTTDESEVIFYKDGKTASVSVIKKINEISILTNGKPDASIRLDESRHTADEITMAMLAGLPLLYSDAKNVANIGFGSGLTSHLLLASDQLERLDTIEIEAEMVVGAKRFGKKVERTFTDPRSHIVIDDAKSYFSSIKNKYDVIVSEPSNPWVNGVASLYTQEFYSLMRENLTNNGILVQWFHLYENNKENLSSVLNAIDSEFKFLKFYFTNSLDIIVLASNKKFSHENKMRMRFSNKIKSFFNNAGINSIEDIEIRYLGDRQTLANMSLINQNTKNSDYFPILAFNAPKSFYLKTQVDELADLLSYPIPIFRWLRSKKDIVNLSKDKTNEFNLYLKMEQASLLVNNGQLEDAKLKFSREIVHSCKSANEPVLIESVHGIALGINAYLSKYELNIYWNTLKGCYSQKQELSKLNNWIELHHAISQMDNERTIQAAIDILSKNNSGTKQQARYIIMALLTAYISEEKFDEAKVLIKDSGIEKNIDLMTRMLIKIVSLHEN